MCPLMHMAYSNHITQTVAHGSQTLGPRLGRWAVRRNISVVQVATITGASRTSVYSWFAGGNVSNPYRAAVNKLLTRLESGKRISVRTPTV